MDKPLADKEIETALGRLPGWARRGDALAKSFEFPDFKGAFAFMTRVAFEAEALNHHPDWSNCYNTVEISLSTHHAGAKVTGKDVELASRIESCLHPRT
jgi:4a-hydroxytetrahydrobiopterin dehydratase